TSSQADPSTLTPFHIRSASTTTTAEFNPAIDRMRQRIGTARNNWTMRERLRAAKLASRSIALSWCGVPVKLFPPREARYDNRTRKRPSKPPSATAQQQAL